MALTTLVSEFGPEFLYSSSGWQKKVRFEDQRNPPPPLNPTQGVGSLKVKLQHAERRKPPELSSHQQQGRTTLQQGRRNVVSSSPEQAKHGGHRTSNRMAGGGQDVSTLIEKAISDSPSPQKKKWNTDILRRLIGNNRKMQATTEGGQDRSKSSIPIGNRQALSGQSKVQIVKRPGPLEEKTSPNSVQLPMIRDLSHEEAVISQKKKDEMPKESRKQRKSLSTWGVLQSSIENATDPESNSSSASSSSEKILGTKSALLNPHVNFVLERLKKLRAGRVQTDVHEEIQAVHERVNQALKNVDFMFDEEYECNQSRVGSVFNVAERRTEIERQSEITDMVKGMIEGSQITQGLLIDVDIWFEEMKALGFDVKVDEELEEIVSSSDMMRSTVMKSLNEFSKSSNKMVDLGNRIIKEAGNIIKENEAQAKKMSRQGKDKTVIYDEHDLMVDQVKWEKAIKLIVNTFEDALKWTRNATYKVVYTKAQKQFKNLSSAMSKKLLDLNGKQRDVDDLKKKLFDAKASVEKKHNESEELKKNIRRMSRNIEEQAKHIETQEKRNQGLTKKLMATEQKMKAMEKEHLQKEVSVKREMEEKEAALEAAMAKSPTPPPPQKKAILKVIDPELVQKLKDTEEQLESSKVNISNMTERIKDLERTIGREKEKVRNLKEDLIKAEKEVEEAAMQITIPETVMEIPESADVSGDKDSAYYKKLLTGMKRDFSQELEKLKSHLRKERQRGTAAMKRNENVYKDHLNAIQKDVIRVLRSIMHFRDHVCGVLEKENLKDPVFALQKLKNLIPDQLAPDPKELLTMLVANVVEYMHNMELIIANAFLAMRMIIKGSVPQAYEQQKISERKADIKVKDAQTRIRTMDSAKSETVQIAKRLKMAKNKLEKIEQLTADEDKTKLKDKKYVALLDRYYQVWKMYNKLQKDMDVLQGDFQTNIDEKIKEQEQFAITNIKLNLKQKKALHENELILSITDQKDNLRILEKAYDDNKISKELYMMSTAMLQKAVSIPGKRLKYLCEQYIAFRSVKDARYRLQKIIEEPDLAIYVRQDLECYMRRMESKMHANMGLWHERLKNLEDERKNVNQVIWKLFNEVLAETGVLLVHPMFKRNKETGEVYSQMAQMLKRTQMKKILKKRGRMTDILKLPPVLVGSNVVSKLQPEQPFWKGVGQGDPMSFEPMVNTPHTLHYDVNKPRINAERLIMDDDMGRPAYPLAKIQNYIINPSMTSVRCQ